jgi:dihydrolipoamide dehydrogenase
LKRVRSHVPRAPRDGVGAATVLKIEGSIGDRATSLPFKGRVGVGMGLASAMPHPPPILPLEGGGVYFTPAAACCASSSARW